MNTSHANQMNKEFELAKFIVTIAGFLIVASGLFFNAAFTIEQNIFSPPSTIEKEHMCSYIDTMENLWRPYFHMAWTLFDLGVLLMIISGYLAFKGYKSAKKVSSSKSSYSRLRKKTQS